MFWTRLISSSPPCLHPLVRSYRRLPKPCPCAALTNYYHLGDFDGIECAFSFETPIPIADEPLFIPVLAALQLSTKRQPELQDKFVLCQVSCYTEGEDSLRHTIDSLAALNYDDKRKLIFLICVGNIIGNDCTTPTIVLDILGVDPSLDPEPLLFKSVGEGSKALNYGKVYSGLYEFEGMSCCSVIIFFLFSVSFRLFD